jgi:site-specific recombinase XerC
LSTSCVAAKSEPNPAARRAAKADTASAHTIKNQAIREYGGGTSMRLNFIVGLVRHTVVQTVSVAVEYGATAANVLMFSNLNGTTGNRGQWYIASSVGGTAGTINVSWLAQYGAEPLGPRTIFMTIRRLCDEVLNRPVHPHMLRHSFASRLRENGADLQDMQEALGHAVITTTTMYAHLTTRRRREKLAAYLS